MTENDAQPAALFCFARRLTRALSLPALIGLGVVLAAPQARADAGSFDALRQASEVAAQGLKEHQPGARVRFGYDTPSVSQITRVRIATEGATFEARARWFLAQYRALFGLDPAQLVLVNEHVSRHKTALRFEQRVAGERVFDRSLTIAMSPQGEVVSVTNNTYPIAEVTRGALDDTQARAIVRARFGAQSRVALSRGIVVDRTGAIEVVRAVIADPASMQTRAVLIETTTHQTRGLRALERN